jgi:UDP-2-acetamido-2,6-beta-L-arabino-hexul-4-ose reductase
MNAEATPRAVLERLNTHRDARGSLFEPLDDAQLRAQRNVHVVLTEPNGVRGNHVHQSATETTCILGPCLVRLKEGGEVRDIEIPAGETWRLTIPPGVVHAFRNSGTSPMVLVSFSICVHDPAGGDTRREPIL